MSDNRRTRYGYTNMGRANLPVVPVPIIMTDRADGTQWALTFDPINNHISINSDLSVRNSDGAYVYSAFEGPLFYSDGQYRLFIRGQRIGIEFVAFPLWEKDADNRPIYARKTSDQTRRQLYLSKNTTNVLGLTLAFTPDKDLT